MIHNQLSSFEGKGQPHESMRTTVDVVNTQQLFLKVESFVLYLNGASLPILDERKIDRCSHILLFLLVLKKSVTI
jgi:hypothetical protein